MIDLDALHEAAVSAERGVGTDEFNTLAHPRVVALLVEYVRADMALWDTRFASAAAWHLSRGKPHGPERIKAYEADNAYASARDRAMAAVAAIKDHR